jgi:hypothetical protein
MIGDDSNGTLHDRYPVRVGRPRYQNCPVDKAINIAGAIDETGLAGNHGLSDAEPGSKLSAPGLDLIRFERACFSARLDGLGSCLDNE